MFEDDVGIVDARLGAGVFTGIVGQFAGDGAALQDAGVVYPFAGKGVAILAKLFFGK
jgi:hypothetical protein